MMTAQPDPASTQYNPLRPWSDRLPDVFVIGGPKCGTTSLYQWLRQHPDTYLVDKEPNFLSRDVFDVSGVPGAVTDWPGYLDRLMPAAEANKLTGDFTPRSLYSDLALDIIGHHPTEPKVIVILRNPIDLVFSLHGQMLREGVEREPDFARAWDRAKSCTNNLGAWQDSAGRIDRRLNYPMFAELGTRLQAWQAQVPPNRLKILILEEDMTSAPAQAFADVLSFLGLPAAEVDLEPKNRRTELRSVELNRMMIGLRQTVHRVLAFSGISVAYGSRRGTGLIKLVNRFNQVKPADASASDMLAPALRAKLATELADEVAKVEVALGRSVTSWRDWPLELSH